MSVLSFILVVSLTAQKEKHMHINKTSLFVKILSVIMDAAESVWAGTPSKEDSKPKGY